MMTNGEIDTRVRQLVAAFLAAQGTPKKQMSQAEINAVQAMTELASNFLQNINDIARRSK